MASPALVSRTFRVLRIVSLALVLTPFAPATLLLPLHFTYLSPSLVLTYFSTYFVIFTETLTFLFWDASQSCFLRKTLLR